MAALELVLLDLDGTLADTAPDLLGALNALRAERGEAALDLEPLKPAIGRGTPAMLEAGFALTHDHPDYAALRERFLDLYAARVAHATELYPGMEALLDELDARRLPWGIVTNKPRRFAEPLLAELGLLRRAACVVCGDTLAKRKPDPEPLAYAAHLVAAAPHQTVYIGDAETDVIAAKGAMMRPLVAGWGYLGPDDQPLRWGAEAVITAPEHLGVWLMVHG
jgi:2-phosphoglycolate phosphatase